MKENKFNVYHLIISALIALLNTNANAQLNYYAYDTLQITEGSNTFNQAFLGGFNSPQFNQIDLNQDGKLDLLIFDRAGDRLVPMINHGGNNQIDYRFAPEYIPYIPKADNQLYTRDFDCDGKMDIIIGNSDLRVYRNTSTTAGGLTFVDSGKIESVFNPGSFSITINPNKSNIIGLNDIDGDGDLDLIREFGSYNQLEYHRNLSIEQQGRCGLIFERRATCWGDYVESNLSSRVYLDSCRGEFFVNPELTGDRKQTYKRSKGNKHGTTSITLLDIDKNGSMDALTSNDGKITMTALYNADSTNPPRVNSHFFKYDTLFPSNGTSIRLPGIPTAYHIDLDNDGLKDLVVAPNTDDELTPGKVKNNIHFYKQDPVDGSYNLENTALFADEFLDFGEKSHPRFFDYNKDGLQDIIVGNKGYYDDSLGLHMGRLALCINNGTTFKPAFDIQDTNFLNIPELYLYSDSTPAQELVPTFYDLDGDGKQDMLLGTKNGRLHFFKDTSLSGPAAFKLIEKNYQGINVNSQAKPFLFDVNEDGLADLIIGNQRGRLSYHENYGTTDEAHFNLSVDSIIWQSDSIHRFYLNGVYNLSKIQAGQKLLVRQARNGNHNLQVEVVNVGPAFVDVKHPFLGSSIDDENNSTAVMIYANEFWGSVELSRVGFNNESSPFLYRDQENNIKLILGSNFGTILLYDSIAAAGIDTFRIIDSSYVAENIGGYTSIGGTDINGDQLTDLVIGNKAGGIALYYGLDNVGFSEKSRNTKIDFKLFPNPADQSLQISIKEDKDIEIRSIELKDIQGRLIKSYSSTQLQIDIRNLSKGVYIISLLTEDRIMSKKFIKK